MSFLGRHFPAAAWAIVVAFLVILSGCTTPPTSPPVTPTVTPSPTPVKEPVNSSPAVLPTPTKAAVSPLTRIFSEDFAVLGGAKPIVIDPAEYGVPYLEPGTEYLLSIDSVRPVNLLVIDSDFADRFALYLPEYGIKASKAPDRTVSFSYGFLYDFPLVVQEENVVKKTFGFTVPRTGKYLVILDPRFHGKFTWDTSGGSMSHDYFRTHLEMDKVTMPPVTTGNATPEPINEVIGLSTGYFGTTKVYPLDEYGYPSLSPGDSIHLSVNTGSPVNILVLDEEGMEAFSRVEPVATTIENRTIEAEHRGYSYGQISQNNGEVFHEDLSLDTEEFIDIPKVSKYYVVLDPRFSYEFSSAAGYPISYEEDFITTKVYVEVVHLGSPLYWKKMGDFSLRKGEYEQAAAYYKKSLDLDPENSDAWYNLGLVLRDLGQYREAIRAFNETLKREPGDADVWEKIGILYLLIENEDAARDAYNRSLMQ